MAAALRVFTLSGLCLSLAASSCKRSWRATHVIPFNEQGRVKHLGSRRLLVKQLCQRSRMLHAHSYPPHIAARQWHLP